MKRFSISTLLWLRHYAMVCLGTLLLSFAVAVFILPFDLIVGGVSSYAIILHRVIPIEWLTVDRLIAILTWGLFFIGLIILGRGFAIKTLLSTAIYPLGVSLFLPLSRPDVLGGFFCMTEHVNPELSLVLSALVGGVLIGVGCALAFLGGGSTGGVDVLAFILCKYFKKLRSSVVLFWIDGIAILLGIFLVKDLVFTLLGILSVLISALMVDKVFLGGDRAFVAQIVTDRPRELSQELINELERSTSLWEIEGGYTGTKHTVVMVSFTLRQYSIAMRVIRRVDPDAFVTIHRAHEIKGEGWTR